MSSLRTGLCSLATALIATLALATASPGLASSTAPALKATLPAVLPIAHFLPVLTRKRKLIRSCNKGDNRKNHASSAVDAWAVACEFPPRSRLQPVSALDTAATIAALGG